MPVMLNGLGDPAAIEKTRFGLAEEFGVEVGYSAADMTKPAEIARMVEDARAAFGKVDVLVNNAGILHIASVEETPPATWDAMLTINLSSAFHAIRATLPMMKTCRSGRIINLASALGMVGAPSYSAYCASKHGTIGLTRAVALEVAEYAITVNAICPGFVLTPLVERELEAMVKSRGITFEQAKVEALATGQPTRRFIATEEIGALAVFLAGDGAASITGAAIPIDGGWTAR